MKDDADVVLSNGVMPGDVSGLVPALRTGSCAPAVIILRGHEQSSGEFLEAGACAYLSKSASPVDLVNPVRDQARWRRKLLDRQ